MTKDATLQLSAAGTLKVDTPDGCVSVRLDHVGLQVVGAMIKAIIGDATQKDLKLAQWAQGLPVESWPPVAKRAQPTVRVGLPRGAP